MSSTNNPGFDASVYAAGGLDADEAAAFEKELESSPAAREQLESFEGVSAELGLALEPVEPPVDLKAALMARIAVTPQQSAEPRSRHAVDPEGAAGPAVPAPVIAAVPADADAAAAVGAVIVGSSMFVGVVENGNQLPQAVALAEVNSASDVQRTTVEVDGEGGTATLVWSGELGKSVLVVNGLPQLPSDKTYELWYIDEAGPVSAGIFDTGADGTGWGVLAGGMDAGDVVAVTIEKSGGSGGTPTTDPVLVVEPA
jgi:anti-sigma-K factor RskA